MTVTAAGRRAATGAMRSRPPIPRKCMALRVNLSLCPHARAKRPRSRLSRSDTPVVLAGDATTITDMTEIELSDYETTLRRALYDPDIWLRTAEAVARWLKFCADNAHTRFVAEDHA
jgi:hypothetical protein